MHGLTLLAKLWLPRRHGSPVNSKLTRFIRTCGVVIGCLGLGFVAEAALAESQSFSAADLEFFENEVRPRLAEHCYECHSIDSETIEGGLRLDSRRAILTGGDTQPAIVPGHPDESLLIDAIEYGDLYEMPPKRKLPEATISVFREWVTRGAPWPQEEAESGPLKIENFDLQKRKAEHWAWTPLARPPLPVVHNSTWALQPLDQFVLAKLEANSLQPAAPAAAHELLRRAYFDLIGLPPPVEVVSEYCSHPTPQAFETIVDKLLDSPQYGERWARHWLDLMRYAETRGHEFDSITPNAWQYRDYVIRAFNADVPYDQFVTEHLAGDLLDPPRMNEEQQFNESIIATGFWYLGEWIHSPVDLRKDELDRFDNAIDVFGKTFLGLTVACARCHDHKFDAISQEDYYALAGFLQSSGYQQVRFETADHNRAVARQLDALRRNAGKQIAAKANELQLRSTQLSPLLLDVNQSEKSEVSDFQWDLPENAHVVLDYGKDQSPWLVDGPAFGDGPLRRGEWIPAADGSRAVAEIVTRGHAKLRPELSELSLREGVEADPSSRMSDQNQQVVRDWENRPGRVLRTPTFELRGGRLYYLIRGGMHVQVVVDSHRLLRGPLHQNTLKSFDNKEQWHWVEHDLRAYMGHRVLVEFSPFGKHPLEIAMVVDGDRMPSLPPELDPSHPSSQLASKSQTLTRLNEAAASPAVQAIVTSYRQERAQLLQSLRKQSATAPAIWDGTSENERLLIRGNALTPGPPVERRLLTAIAGENQPAVQKGSGRLQLAQQLLASENPLPARVMANRIWHHLTGRGIVPSVDNLGVLGQAPTHPELLDHLASRFIDNGWSVKALVREIMLSRTYQMSSREDPLARARDPDNRLLHRMPVRRLQSEVIRDSMLSLSHRLDLQPFGPSVPIHLTSFMQGRGRPEKSGPLDGDGRRSIYIAVRRNFLSPMMLTFDSPQPAGPVGKRTVSNVPAQALILLNDPFVMQQAERFAKQLLATEPLTQQRIERMYLEAFARLPDKTESSAAAHFLDLQRSEYSALDSEPDSQLKAWTDLCHVLFNLKEFTYLH